MSKRVVTRLQLLLPISAIREGTVNTIFHNTKTDLQKWFLAVALVLNAKKGISSRQLARDIEVNKNTAWFMGMRIRRAMLENGALLQGIIEMDETYIGGKPRKGQGKRGRGTAKVPVVGMMERGGDVTAKVSTFLNAKRLALLVRRHIDTGASSLMTDEFRGYTRMKDILPHQTVNHTIEYVKGNIHTNNIEGFWALLKRGIIGQYHKVSIRHLQRYVDEFAYRFNNRKNLDVFDMTLLRAVGGVA